MEGIAPAVAEAIYGKGHVVDEHFDGCAYFVDSADGKAVSLNNALFKFVSQKGVKYNDFVSLAGLKPALTDLYKGGEAEGIVYGMVDEGDQPLVVFLERNDGGIWFSVE